MSAAVFGQRYEPGYGRSFALAFAIHAMLIAVMFFGVRMQSYKPDTVSVELWEPPPPPEVRVVEPPPKIEPEPPKLEPRPEPKVEKPQIVEKAAPKPKPEAKPKPKPAPRDLELEKRAREELAREQGEFRDRQMKAQAVREQENAHIRALAAWSDKIRSKIRSNISSQAAEQVGGNPESWFEVTLLPTGEVLTAKMLRSSGNRVYDDAVERAIFRSSPLPKPDQPGIFQRQLKLTFRPQDK